MPRTIEVILLGKDQLSGTLGGVQGSLSGLGKVAVGLGLGAAAGVGILGAAMAKLALDAVPVEQTRLVFERLNESIGETADTMLTKMREASMGMVADADLMGAANKLISMGLAESADEASKLTQMAVTLGAAMGKGPTEAMEEFALMLANQSIPRLDTFGISAGKVRERINELMEADKDLTREQAFMQAVMEQGEISLDRVGDISGTTASTMGQLSATIKNIKVAIGEALLPVLNALLKPLSALLSQYGPRISAFFEEWGKKIGYLIEPFMELIGLFMGGGDWVGFLENEVWEVLDNAFGGEMANKIVEMGKSVGKFAETALDAFRNQIIPAIREAAEIVLPILQRAIGFVVEHWQTFAKIGAVVGAAILAISSPITIVIGAIAALVAAWMTNWGGIQDKLRAVWAFLQPIFEAIGKAITFIKENILPPLREAFDKVWTFIKEAVAKAWEGFKPHIEEMKEALKEFWEKIEPRLKEAWEAIRNAMRVVADWIRDTLIPVLRRLWDRLEPVREIIYRVARAFGDFMGSAAVMALRGFLEGLILLWDALTAAIRGAFNIIGNIISRIGGLIDVLGRLRLPSWLTPGSMTPLEGALKGIADAFAGIPGAMPGGMGGMGGMALTAGGEAVLRVEVKGLPEHMAEEWKEEILREALGLLYPGR